MHLFQRRKDNLLAQMALSENLTFSIDVEGTSRLRDGEAGWIVARLRHVDVEGARHEIMDVWPRLMAAELMPSHIKLVKQIILKGGYCPLSTGMMEQMMRSNCFVRLAKK